MQNTKQIITTIAICFAVTGFVGIAYSWTPPSATPPDPNVPAPINVGTTTQIFSGNKILNMGTAGANVLTVNGGFLLNGLLNVENRIRASYNGPAWGIAISAAPTGGWERKYGFSTSNGLTILGGFGGIGGAETLSHLYMGKGYTDYVARLDLNTNNIHLNGKVGIGVEAPTANLDVNGTVKISGGSPGAGKVLTSDATGNASWQAPGGSNSGPFLGSSLVYSRTTSGAISASLEPGTYIIEMKGAGGGGGGASWNDSNPESGGGGGEGETVYYRVTLNSTTAVSGSVGVGGTGGTPSVRGGLSGELTRLTIEGTTITASGGHGGCYISSSGAILAGVSCGNGGGNGAKTVSTDLIRIGGAKGEIPIKNTDNEDSVPAGNGGGQFGGRGGTRNSGGGSCILTESSGTPGYSGGGGGGSAHNECANAGRGGDGYIYIWKQ